MEREIRQSSITAALCEAVRACNRHMPTTGARDLVSPDRMPILEKTASQAIDLLAADKDFDAYSLLEAGDFDAEEKVALWTYFDSKQRRRLKEQAALEQANQRKAA